ncbi:MAG: hypothetical protein JNL79_21465 [Myxococcales bacterium]|nr:hypothetical protein [Myxococcales bacterium]
MSPTVRINQFSDENRRKRRLVKMQSILGVLHDLLHAERVVRRLHESGFSSKDISLLVRDREGGSGVDPMAVAAGLLGGALAMLAGVSVLVVPGLGPLVAAGPLLSAVSAAMAGTTMGGIASGLITLGVPELEARRYEKRVRGGHVLLSVHTDSVEDLEHLKTLFETELADDVCATSDPIAPARKDARVHP